MNSSNHIDINADLGEGSQHDAAIMPYITSCSIACGGHAGDEESIRKTILLAKQHNVKVGAHPAFPDRENFGRKLIEMNAGELQKVLSSQLEGFYAICEDEGMEMHHIKAHGALYNQGSERDDYVEVMLNVFGEFADKPILYLQDRSKLQQAAEGKFKVWKEGFIDRRYETAGKLLSRLEVGALIQNAELAWKQFERMHFENQLIDHSGKSHSYQADTYCIHGDHENSLEILQYIHRQLKAKKIELK